MWSAFLMPCKRLKFLNINVDDIGSAFIIIIPDVILKLLPGTDNIPVDKQIRQQLVLLLTEMDRSSAS